MCVRARGQIFFYFFESSLPFSSKKNIKREKKKKDTEEDNTIKAELGDNLFVLLCIANSLNIDMTESFNDTMNKFNTRDKNRFERK